MKTVTIDGVNNLKFIIVQNDQMEVTAFKVDSETGKRSLEGKYLGVWGNIKHTVINGYIAQLLFMP